MVYGRCNIINGDSKIFRETKTIPFNLLDYAYGLFTIPQQATFWRRNIFFKVGMFNIKNHTCMDGELWLKFAKNKANIKYVNKVLANFRLHPHSISGSGRLSKQYYRDRVKIQRNLLGYNPNRLRTLLRRLSFLIRHPIFHVRYYFFSLSKKSFII